MYCQRNKLTGWFCKFKRSFKNHNNLPRWNSSMLILKKTIIIQIYVFKHIVNVSWESIYLECCTNPYWIYICSSFFLLPPFYSFLHFLPCSTLFFPSSLYLSLCVSLSVFICISVYLSLPVFNFIMRFFLLNTTIASYWLTPIISSLSVRPELDFRWREVS